MSDTPQHVAAIGTPPMVTIEVPGSKSQSCRAIMLAAIATGPSTLRGLLMSDDTIALLSAIEAMGVGVQVNSAQVALAPPESLGCSAHASVNLGHGGTPARFMMALASLGRGQVLIDGSPRLRARPMADGLALLQQVGIQSTAHDAAGHLPVSITGGDWTSSTVQVGAAASSQFVSAMLLTAPATKDGIRVEFQSQIVSESYVRLTVHALEAWGIDVTTHQHDGRLQAIDVPPGRPVGGDHQIRADASSALFWATAAAIIPGSVITLPGVSLQDGQPDAAGIHTLASMGLHINVHEDGICCTGPETLHSVDTIDCAQMPDAAPALAVACCWANRPTRLTGLGTLRDKESDRVATIAGELNRAGFAVQTEGDDLLVTPCHPEPTPVTVQTWDDHRIAMAMAIMGLRRGEVAIADPAVTTKSYPGFWDDLGRLVGSGQSGDTAPA